MNKINALVILPFESASLTQPVAQSREGRVRDRRRPRPDRCDRAGRLRRRRQRRLRPAGRRVHLARLNGKGNIVVLRGLPTTVDNERVDAFNERDQEVPGHQGAGREVRNWNRDDAFKVMQDYLTRFKQIDAVWAADDDMAIGVHKAIEQAKRTDIKIVVGGAAQGRRQEAHGRRQAGPGRRVVLAEFIYDAIKMTADARLKGDALPAKTIVPSVLITKENAQAVLLPGFAVLSARGARAMRSWAASRDHNRGSVR